MPYTLFRVVYWAQKVPLGFSFGPPNICLKEKAELVLAGTFIVSQLFCGFELRARRLLLKQEKPQNSLPLWKDTTMICIHTVVEKACCNWFVQQIFLTIVISAEKYVENWNSVIQLGFELQLQQSSICWLICSDIALLCAKQVSLRLSFVKPKQCLRYSRCATKQRAAAYQWLVFGWGSCNTSWGSNSTM